uniref:Uncharacterized protein n=1 Tax=Timema cristinae TaxID=61476 RepID=A0A7R9H9Y9_TIMCR|nr:unnamed protein product [Timema cristinae]
MSHVPILQHLVLPLVSSSGDHNTDETTYPKVSHARTISQGQSYKVIQGQHILRSAIQGQYLKVSHTRTISQGQSYKVIQGQHIQSVVSYKDNISQGQPCKDNISRSAIQGQYLKVSHTRSFKDNITRSTIHEHHKVSYTRTTYPKVSHERTISQGQPCKDNISQGQLYKDKISQGQLCKDNIPRSVIQSHSRSTYNKVSHTQTSQGQLYKDNISQGQMCKDNISQVYKKQVCATSSAEVPVVHVQQRNRGENSIHSDKQRNRGETAFTRTNNATEVRQHSLGQTQRNRGENSIRSDKHSQQRCNANSGQTFHCSVWHKHSDSNVELSCTRGTREKHLKI